MIYNFQGKNESHSHLDNKSKFIILVLFALSMIIFGLIVQPPKEIFYGIIDIILERDVLITDYIAIGGIGAAFVNSGILTLIFIFILYMLKININGIAFAAIFSIAGFSLFGKNLLNVWFVVLGVYLYAKIQREKFSKYVYMALFGTAMSPITTEFIYASNLPYQLSVPIGALIGVFIGLILPPISSHLLKMHQGFNLYNVGFTAGLISTVAVALFKAFDIVSSTRLIYSTGNNHIFMIYLYSVFSVMVFYGLFKSNFAIKKYLNIWKYSGRVVTDFMILEGLPLTLINMGLTGIMSTTYIVIVGGELNGPTIGGILTVVGFSAFGKHPKNILPIFIGVYLGALIKVWDVNDPSMLLAALFGTALAPIAGEFGFFIGVLAAFIHSSVVHSVVFLHGGLNLYNNGFSAGIVAALLVPIIDAFRKDDKS